MAQFGLKRTLKRAVYLAASHSFKFTGIPMLRRGSRGRRSLTVLMYHKINASPLNSISVSPVLFAEQMEYLSDRYQVIDVDTVLRCISNGYEFPENAVLLTFDDGYRDNLIEAYPVLKKHGFRALLFIPTDFPGAKGLPHDAKIPPPNPTLTWQEIQSLHGVFEIGSHGCSHASLSSLSPDEARAEIVRSREILQSKLGVPIRAFAYPTGTPADYNASLEEEVRAAGYELCFTTVPKVNTGDFNPLAICRYNVEDFGMTYFKLIMDGSSDLLSLKETWIGRSGKRLINRLLGTTGE
jgi:peptidoglycan/xylan/chitin deacetylase (PgdA/CDA1 family)